MKKSVVLIALSSLFTTSLTQAGGTLGGNSGDISKIKEVLEASWNGEPGIQNTSAYGVIVQWKADACGTLNGSETGRANCAKSGAKWKGGAHDSNQ
ncbi:hypothetical protein [Photobacterium galatheae]|uniref:Uncharacterized protein n=1 Tax=Photobacterium galatheae TaxID=1654360 RepID=A0A066RRH9_9GAMM|nr:hypothetical protein [Photobacterium galatheae]KDM90277.1 hypothetical protein EA58_17975 [Photobacterium galatheae]